MRINLNDRHVPMRMVARVQPVALLKWLKAAASVITVFTPSGGFRGRIRENGEKALIGSLPYRAGKATEDIASFRHHPLHGVRGRGNVVDKANSLSGQPGHLLPIAHCVLGRQNYVEFAQHQVLFVLVAYRLLAPGSEWRLHREWFLRSALADLLGEDAGVAEIHKLYRCHDRLLIYKQAVFDHLAARWRDLFNVSYDVLLYDLTSTYFEADPPFAEGDKR